MKKLFALLTISLVLLGTFGGSAFAASDTWMGHVMVAQTKDGQSIVGAHVLGRGTYTFEGISITEIYAWQRTAETESAISFADAEVAHTSNSVTADFDYGVLYILHTGELTGVMVQTAEGTKTKPLSEIYPASDDLYAPTDFAIMYSRHSEHPSKEIVSIDANFEPTKNSLMGGGEHKSFAFPVTQRGMVTVQMQGDGLAPHLAFGSYTQKTVVAPVAPTEPAEPVTEPTGSPTPLIILTGLLGAGLLAALLYMSTRDVIISEVDGHRKYRTRISNGRLTIGKTLSGDAATVTLLKPDKYLKEQLQVVYPTKGTTVEMIITEAKFDLKF